MSSTEASTTEFLPTTSFVLIGLQQTNPKLLPTEAVACMNCPLAVWMLVDKTLKCYCRTLCQDVWETSKQGKIRVCDAPEQVREEAEQEQQISETPRQPTPFSQTPAPSTGTGTGTDSDSFGLLEQNTPAHQAGPGDFM